MLLNLVSLDWTWALLLTCSSAIAALAYLIYQRHLNDKLTVPVSVNYFFTRKCNKECGFCFHTEKTSYVASEADMKRGLRLLREAGMRKINFAGGEPFLYPDKLAMLCRFCKDELGLESVSIITNGTKVSRKWIEKYGRWVDVMGVSCDSFNEQTNIAIGRGSGENVMQLFRIRDWCRKFHIKFKLNTQLDPFRWKVFQVLYVEGENDETDSRLTKRKSNAKKLLITDEQYEAFCAKHRHLSCMIPEPNSVMASSYLLVDEYFCFLDKGAGKEKQSRSILEVGVQTALSEIYWDQEAFNARGGIFDWTKDEGNVGGCGSSDEKALEW
ncbi:hypothetical protein F5Y15DRAFT_413741 [Xylariaceae sp. FL0016]|nr:hypothetical protein F5Y15DRAFT_413741 [Xylariaceae sp. FL0016]